MGILHHTPTAFCDIPITLGVLLISFFLFLRDRAATRLIASRAKNASPARIKQISHLRGYDAKPFFLNFQNFPRSLFDAQFPQLCGPTGPFRFRCESVSTANNVSARCCARGSFLPSASQCPCSSSNSSSPSPSPCSLRIFATPGWDRHGLVLVSVMGLSNQCVCSCTSSGRAILAGERMATVSRLGF